MSHVKEGVEEILRSLPDDATYEEVIEALIERMKIERALEDLREGRVFTQEEMEQKFSVRQ
jgi:predicted transcriptional regulator